MVTVNERGMKMSSLFGTLTVSAEKYPDIYDAKNSLDEELTNILVSEIYRHNYQEACDVASSIIRDHVLYDNVFDSYNRAESFLNGKMRSGGLVACKYLKPTGMDKKYLERERRLKYEMEEYEKKHAICNYSKTLKKHCPHCSSDVNVKYFEKDNCPVCGADLRSETVKKTLKRYEERIAKAKELYIKSKKKDVLCWMFVFEAYAG